MKKILSITFLTLISIAYSLYCSGQITPGKLAVYRVGTGSSVASNRTVPVFIDQYNTTGTAQSPDFTIAVPVSANGTNRRLTAIMKSSATVYNLEGMSGLSPDGQYLAIIGYDQETGSSSVSDVDKVIGVLDAAGNLNTSTSVSGNSPARSVVPTAGGSHFYSATLGSGILYSALGASTATQVSTNVSNARSYTIFNNKLYCANNASAVPYFSPLPTNTGTSPKGTITLPGISNVNQVALFDTDGDGEPNLIYAANDGTGPADAGLFKFALENSSWVAKGSIKITGTTDGLKSITGKVSGKNILLYAATWGNLSTSVPSQLLAITDENAATSSISNTTELSVLATAANNTVFRSVSFTPGTTPETTLPVKLTSFQAKFDQQQVNLNWETSLELNNSHFEVLRSTDGVQFSKIGQVSGKGNSTQKNKYTFTDQMPSPGTNYYRLKQVDFDGKAELSNIISIKLNMKQENIFISAGKNEPVSVNISTDEVKKTRISVYNLSGNVILDEEHLLAIGENKIDLPKDVAPGLYIAAVTIGTKSSKLKFVVQ
ncbi:T9SS type A sorting domain-containing protein [Desertivirga xinjiangensis]|uniref:T9SS type A sorting domain-containing protein n=1 Tax=Desertivirga xinjiangensis TaxID=539206 RepID=UPI00210DDC7A|nr:T9SS type A sorting domain-containing protein [Pedobacter xinjiangensis]